MGQCGGKSFAAPLDGTGKVLDGSPNNIGVEKTGGSFLQSEASSVGTGVLSNIAKLSSSSLPMGVDRKNSRNLTAREKEIEKVELQSLVRDFAKDAMKGLIFWKLRYI